MSEKERVILSNLEKVLPYLTDAKKEYLIGYGDGLAAALQENTTNEPTRKAG